MPLWMQDSHMEISSWRLGTERYSLGCFSEGQLSLRWRKNYGGSDFLHHRLVASANKIEFPFVGLLKRLIRWGFWARLASLWNKMLCFLCLRVICTISVGWNVHDFLLLFTQTHKVFLHSKCVSCFNMPSAKAFRLSFFVCVCVYQSFIKVWKRQRKLLT